MVQPSRSTFLRIAAHSFGDPARVLACEEADMPPIPAGSVLVRMLVSPINPSDLIPVTGAYPLEALPDVLAENRRAGRRGKVLFRM